MNNLLSIEKRDKTVVPYDLTKIKNAMEKAIMAINNDVDENISETLLTLSNQVKSKCLEYAYDHSTTVIPLEVIQNFVEETLVEANLPDVAKEYILYRNKRNEIRNTNFRISECIDEILNKSSIDSNLKRDNANINGDTAMGTMLQIGANSSKIYYLENMINKTAAEHHKQGLIHIHDLDFYALTVTCCQIDCLKLFKNGFATGNGFLREPNSIASYAALAAIAIQSDQNDCHGGQSIPNFDYSMAPGVKKSFRKIFISELVKLLQYSPQFFFSLIPVDNEYAEKLVIKHEKALEKELSLSTLDKFVDALGFYDYTDQKIIKFKENIMNEIDRQTFQAMESFVHNLNTMASRAGSQVPFSSINLGTDTSEEGRMVTKNLLKAMEAGLGHGETAIFPIVVFKVKKGVNFDKKDPNYDLLRYSFKVTSKRLFPNYVFLDAPQNIIYYKEGHPETETSAMGCVQGDEIITYKMNNTLYVESFEKAYERIKEYFITENKYGRSKYINTSGVIQILDSMSGGFVDCKKIIKNPNMNNWVKVKFDNGKCLTATLDHPLPVFSEANNNYERKYISDIKIGVKIPVTNNQHDLSLFRIYLTNVVSIERVDIDECSYDVETASDRFDVSGIVSHNCRTRVMGNVNGPEISYSRGNLSFTSINLPRLAYLSKSEEDFFDKLQYEMEVVKSQLLERFEIQCKRKVKNMPFLMGQGVWLDSDKLKSDDEVREVLKHGTLAIGFVGLAECMTVLYGHHHGEGEEYEKKALEIVRFMRNYTDKFTEDTHLNFGLLATPAESLAGRFLEIDRKEFGIIPGMTDKDFYTNSFHIPVNFNITIFDKIKLEAPFHELTNGGHITYVELNGDTSSNVDVIEKIVRYMAECGIGYGSINHPVDRDPVCGYTGVINDECPNCHRHETADEHFERIRRITGYLVGDLSKWNNGKRAEESMRVKHGINYDLALEFEDE